MLNQKDAMLEILRHNRGFTNPERWIEYGITHGFKKIQTQKLEECPDCGAQSLKFLGQYVYYSTLVNLQMCTQCGLVFTDIRLDPNVIQAHFEQAYKDEAYFVRRRCRIFDQITNIADSVAPQGGRILDVGGAKGHLLSMLKRRRPDLNCVLNDLSREACDHAKSEYGFQTILGGINELDEISLRFDVIIFSDVIYYEPELRRLWAVLAHLISENGTVIFRVPNKLSLIHFSQFITLTTSSHEDKEMHDRIKFFNPEHLFVFSRQYLLRKLKNLGFHRIVAMPSELLIHDRIDLLHPFFYYFCKLFSVISFNRLILTPSLLIIAKNNGSRKKIAPNDKEGGLCSECPNHGP